MNPIVHFEMPAEDRIRMAEFYQKSFGWKTQMLGPDMMDYTLVTTTETDTKGMIKEPGRINGGFYMKKNMPLEHPTVVIEVYDLQESMEKVADAGGRVLGAPTEIPGYGTYVSFLDTEGNRVSMIQPVDAMK